MSTRSGPPPGSRYQDQRRYVVAATMDDLRGPSGGTVRLSSDLDWSGDPGYDLGDDGDAALMYQAVLNQASTAADLNRWLDAGTLRRLWPILWLPAELRRAWENAFPDLPGTPRALAG